MEQVENICEGREDVVSGGEGPVIDTPVINFTDGNTFKFQCTPVHCKPGELDTLCTQNEAEKETENSEQSRALESLSKKIAFRPYPTKIEIIFIHGETAGEGREVPCEVIVVNKLMPASRYKIQITNFTDDKQVCEMELYISTRVPLGPPVNFNVTKRPNGFLFASWEKPQVEDGCEINRYLISVCSLSLDGFKQCDKYAYTRACKGAYIATGDEISYTFEIQACSEDFTSEASKQKWTSLRHEMLMDAKRVEGNKVKPSYLVNKTKTTQRIGVSFTEIKKQPFSDVAQTEKVVLLVGETGTGKTTWINALLNYLVGVKYEEDCRFKLVNEENTAHQEFGQTQNINMYKIHPKEGFTISFALTLIDTPGLGDPRGITSDRSIREQLPLVFDIGSGFVDHLDAIAFMTKASNQRLHPLQQYVCSSVLELFGNDTKDNIYVMFSYGSKSKPQTLSALKAAGFPYKTYFKFNHGAIFEDIQEPDECEDEDVDDWGENNEHAYKMGMKNFEKFLTSVTSTQATSISLTREVLENRLSLQVKIRELNRLVDESLSQMEELKSVISAIEMYDNKLASSVKKVTKKESTRSWGTVCIECKYTCHEKCLLYFDWTKSTCDVMDRSKSPASCTKCPQKCTWKYHKNLSYIYKEDFEKAVTVLHDRKLCYEELEAEKIMTEETCKKIQQEVSITDAKIKGNLSEITDCLKQLNEIGLKKDKISPAKYIGILIEREQENTSRQGWNVWLALLREIREQATKMSKNDDDDPFRKYREMAEQIREKYPDIAENQVWGGGCKGNWWKSD